MTAQRELGVFVGFPYPSFPLIACILAVYIFGFHTSCPLSVFISATGHTSVAVKISQESAFKQRWRVGTAELLSSGETHTQARLARMPLQTERDGKRERLMGRFIMPNTSGAGLDKGMGRWAFCVIICASSVSISMTGHENNTQLPPGYNNYPPKPQPWPVDSQWN